MTQIWQEMACKHGIHVCYNYIHLGHLKVDCPIIVARAVYFRKPTTLKIIDGRDGSRGPEDQRKNLLAYYRRGGSNTRQFRQYVFSYGYDAHPVFLMCT